MTLTQLQGCKFSLKDPKISFQKQILVPGMMGPASLSAIFFSAKGACSPPLQERFSLEELGKT